jgi:hypothetical protein
MNSKKQIFVTLKDNIDKEINGKNLIYKNNNKESTGDHSIKNKNDIMFNEQKDSISEFNSYLIDNNDSFLKSDDDESLSKILFPQNDLSILLENNDNYDLNDFLNNDDYNNINSFKKNRNNNNNNLLNEEIKDIVEENKDIDENKNNNDNIRCDSLLIKFKSTIGKWFINRINNKIKNLKDNSIIKRRIKLYSLNYKKFTLKVTYNQNKEWLKYKMKDLLLLGDEDNQVKNQKNINIIYKKKELSEIKNILESDYENIIQEFYLSDEFNKLKNDDKIKELNNNFIKIMKISLLDNNGFIQFYETRKGNNTKNRDN